MDEYFRSQQSPRGDSHLNVGAFVSPPRTVPQLPRRFTTDSGRVPTLSSITNMRGSDNKESNMVCAAEAIEACRLADAGYKLLMRIKDPMLTGP
jgi:hypothetical protein